MPFYVIKKDIVTMATDAIVNAANTELLEGGGVCGAIFEAAGAEAMRKACAALAPISTGSAVLTPGFQLPAKWVIHTAGPVYEDGRHGEKDLLRRAYRESLQLAHSHGMKSVAFPLISAGIYGYPREEAFEVAETAIMDFLENHTMTVYLCLYPDKFRTLVSLGIGLEDFIRIHVKPEPPVLEEAGFASPCSDDGWGADGEVSIGAVPPMEEPKPLAEVSDELDRRLAHLDVPFSTQLLHLIDAKGLKDPDVYNAAYIDRRLFNKIKKPDYRPRKETVLALAFGLKLTVEETEAFLRAAGYALTESSKTDVICTYFLMHHMYDVAIVNAYLLDYDQKPLGFTVRN